MNISYLMDGQYLIPVSMEIKIWQLVEGARMATGHTVIIDVFRAFSTACYLVGNRADRLIVTGSVETAFRLKKLFPSYILVGERNEKKIPGFDYGNSPAAVRDIDFSGKTIVLTTSAGTQGILNAINAHTVITGSFVNAQAIVRYIRKECPELLSLVCMGYSGQRPVEEDTYCAEYIKNELTGHANDFRKMVRQIRHTSGKRFFLPENLEHAPPEDFRLCLDLNRFDFVLKARQTGTDQYDLERIVV
jgi:2-phosphosulfolactate phosphatase